MATSSESLVALPDRLVEKLVRLPETGMGFHLVRIELRNGLILRNRVVLNSEFLKVMGSEVIGPAEIVDVALEE